MLAHQLATGQKTTHDLIDENFDKYAFRDRDGLPDWFIDDESKHDKKQKPITKEAAQAIKDKTRALNARPIKKVRYLTLRRAPPTSTLLIVLLGQGSASEEEVQGCPEARKAEEKIGSLS